MAQNEHGLPEPSVESLSDVSGEDSLSFQNVRYIRVVILSARSIESRKLIKAPPSAKGRKIVVHRDSTFGDVQRTLEEEQAEKSEWTITVLQANFGAQPYWNFPALDAKIAIDCQMLYAVNSCTHYVLALVRSPLSDYPLALAEPPENRPLNLIQAVNVADSSLEANITSINGFSSARSLRTEPYDYGELKKKAGETFPTSFIVTIGKPSGQFQLDMPLTAPPFLQIPLVNCQKLLWRTYGLKKFALEMIHLSSALLHNIIALSRVLETAKGDPDAENMLEIAPVLVDNLQTLLDTLRGSVESVEKDRFDELEVQNVIHHTFRALCGEYPGALNVRHSRGDFDRLIRLDGNEESTSTATIIDEEMAAPIHQQTMHGVGKQTLIHTRTGHIHESPSAGSSNTGLITGRNEASTVAEPLRTAEERPEGILRKIMDTTEEGPFATPVDITQTFRVRQSSQMKRPSRGAVEIPAPIPPTLTTFGGGPGSANPIEHASSGMGQGTKSVRDLSSHEQSRITVDEGAVTTTKPFKSSRVVTAGLNWASSLRKEKSIVKVAQPRSSSQVTRVLTTRQSPPLGGGAYYSEKIYQGPEAIVVAMDIGTTQSAVSFAYFSPGNEVQGKMVASWPGSSWNGADKTPSMVSYRDGVLIACGAEALQDFEEDERNVAYWFKLHLHPALISQSNPSDSEIPPLPVGITVEEVYADMMRYLMENTQRTFEKTNPNGAEIWTRLRDTIVIVLATPNGWDIREQATLRKAAISASLVTEENASQLLQFVTESEASVHYALANYPREWLQKDTIFAVVDCGGSTVDTAVYRCLSVRPLSLKETCPSECVQAGGIFVDRQVRKMLENKLKGSAFSDPDFIKSMTDAFEKELKPKFDGVQYEYELKFGGIRDNDPSLRINRGKIALSNQDLKPVFDAVTDKICKSCEEVLASQRAEYVLLVGGFGDSPYVQKVLSQRLYSRGMQIVMVQDYGRKAAAQGAIIGHIKQFVVARAAKATFGGCVRQLYQRKLHRERRHANKVYADGKRRVDGAFHVWIKKGTVLQGTFAHKLAYHVAWDTTSTSKSELHRMLRAIEIEVFAWEGDDIPPIWCKDEHGAVLRGMRLICTLNADLSALAGGLQIHTSSRGRTFYRVDYNVCVYFGGTQLRATLQWNEMGALREGPVKVMPYVS